MPSSSSQGRKRRYVYYEQISFLAPILEVTQTEDNLDESDDEPTAGPSATATSASEQEPAREDIEIPETQQDAATESHEGGTESAQTNTQGSSTQQTTTPATQSTQTNVLPRFAPQPLRARRIRRPEEMRSLPEIIDTRIIHIMNTLIPETDAERFCRSLSTSLTKIPSDRQERVRAAMLTLLSASQAEQEPVRVYEAIENWRTIMQQHTVPNTTDNQNTISTQTTMATVIVNNPLLQQSGQPSMASSTLFPTPIRQGYVATNTGALSTVQSATSQQPLNFMNLQPTQTTTGIQENEKVKTFNVPVVGHRILSTQNDFVAEHDDGHWSELFSKRSPRERTGFFLTESNTNEQRRYEIARNQHGGLIIDSAASDAGWRERDPENSDETPDEQLQAASSSYNKLHCIFKKRKSVNECDSRKSEKILDNSNGMKNDNGLHRGWSLQKYNYRDQKQFVLAFIKLLKKDLLVLRKLQKVTVDDII
ncbi:uncharacterized protein ACNLHF_001306 [Anomaloglossus baeobatrachus]